MDRPFWRGKRVLVTGHTGFKGSWLSLWLQEARAELLGYALPPPTEPSLFQLADVAGAMKHVAGDVRDREHLARVFADFRPEVVFHLAAQPLVRESYAQPAETFAANVQGTVHLLEAIRTTPGVKAAVIVTTDKVYQSKEWVWGYREEDRLGGHDPYSASKACAELVTASYAASFFPSEGHARHGVALATARAGNVIGGGDWARDRIVPDVVRAYVSGDKLKVRNPTAVRPWQHVLEPLDGYLTLAQKLHREGPRYGGAWNFGPEDRDSRSVEEVITALSRHLDSRVAWAKEQQPQPHETHALRLDCSRARLVLGWRPRLDLDAALQWVAEWFKDWDRGTNVRAISIRDIARFEDMTS
jgi:CDP-glucose 4,6-dehydratase